MWHRRKLMTCSKEDKQPFWMQLKKVKELFFIQIYGKEISKITTVSYSCLLTHKSFFQINQNSGKSDQCNVIIVLHIQKYLYRTYFEENFLCLITFFMLLLKINETLQIR